MEFLLTYGWAILVVMMVGVVLWDLGFFDMSGEVYAMRGFAPIKPQLNAADISYTGNAYEFEAPFLNTLGTNIEITGVTTTFPGGGCINNWVRYEDFNQPMEWGTSVTIPKGEHFGIWAEGCAVGSSREDTIKITVEITYNAHIGGQSTTRTATGEIKGPVN